MVGQPLSPATTRLRVVETGLDEIEWPDEQKSKYAEEHNSGWGTHLSNLRAYASRQPNRRSSLPREDR